MSLLETINDDLKQAMKNRDAQRLSTLRMLRSELKNREIEQGSAPSDEETAKVIRKMLKQRRESIDAYNEAGRDELAAQEEAEAAILEEYLPKELSDAEIDAIIAEVRDGLPDDAADFGRVMGPVMKQVAGRADGNRVRARVEAALG